MMQTWVADLQLTPARRLSMAGRTERFLDESVAYRGPGFLSDLRPDPGPGLHR